MTFYPMKATECEMVRQIDVGAQAHPDFENGGAWWSETAWRRGGELSRPEGGHVGVVREFGRMALLKSKTEMNDGDETL